MLCSAVAEMFCFLFTDIVRPAGFIQWSASDPRTSTFTSSLYLEPFRLPSKFEADSRTVFPLPVPNVTHFIEAGSYGPGWDAAARANNSAVETVLDITDAREQYSLEKIFGEAMPSWIDPEVL
jgi:hypothetical protein